MHPFLQPQRSSSRQACVASGRVAQHYIPTAIFISVPPPFTWRWKLRSRDHRLCPTVTGLVSSPLCVLEKCCLCRRKIVNSSTFQCETVLPGPIDKFLTPSTVVQQDYKSFERKHAQMTFGRDITSLTDGKSIR